MMLASMISHSLQAYGYWAVAGAVGLESLGVPFPGETTLIAAALYAGSTHRLSIVAIVIVASAAAIVGDNIGYLLGRTGGYRLLRRYGRYLRVDDAKIKVGRYLFDQHGGKMVFFGRFISVLRTYAAFLAGTNRMRMPRFMAYNAAGGIAWAALFGFGAYSMGAAIHQVSTALLIAGGVIAAAAILTAFFVMRTKMRVLEQRAEEAYPDVGSPALGPAYLHRERTLDGSRSR